jgi:sugar lactone lactonase YvrE
MRRTFARLERKGILMSLRPSRVLGHSVGRMLIAAGCMAAISAVLLAQSSSPSTQATPQQLRQKAKAENVPDIPYESVPDFIKMPPNIYLGEAMGVATNSQGHVFVFTRSQATRLFEFDAQGNYVRELGQGNYALVFAHAVRVDPSDNVWVVDEGSNMVVEFNPEGRVIFTLGRRPPATAGPVESDPRGKPASPKALPYVLDRPTDIGWDKQGNIFISDGYGNSRVVKYDKDGRFVAETPGHGSGPSQLDLPHSLQVDHDGNVYVADRSNNRIQVFDDDLHFKAIYDNVGQPWTLCISEGPHQYLYSSNSWPDTSNAVLKPFTGEIYKMELDGRILGKFGRAGKKLGEFSTTHGIDCRNPDQLYISEITAWRVQKLLLHPTQ